MSSVQEDDSPVTSANIGAAAEEPRLPVVVIGAGPVGLAAAAQLMKRTIPVVVFEAGMDAGDHIANWGHVRMFTPWRSNIDDACTALLREAGWTPPQADHYPTGKEFLDDYLHKLAAIHSIAGCLRLGTRVVAVSRRGLGRTKSGTRAQVPFEVSTIDRFARPERTYASAIIDASGTWGKQSPLGSSGVPAPGESAHRDRIHYGMPDILGAERANYLGKRVLVAGSGYSAIGNLVSCAELIDQDPQTRVYWARRRDAAAAPEAGLPDRYSQSRQLKQRLEALIEARRIEVLSLFELDALDEGNAGSLVVHCRAGAQRRSISVDRIVSSTGPRPELSMLGELWLDLDPAFECARGIAGLIDPARNTCGTVKLHGADELAQPEPNFFMVGMKSYGRASTFLLTNGYEQSRSVAAYLAGDQQAAVYRAGRATCGG
ncbi:MAG: FAD-dependent oxidoreductase [Steroidobacteraceae bacterium]